MLLNHKKFSNNFKILIRGIFPIYNITIFKFIKFNWLTTFREVSEDEIAALKDLAGDFDIELWITALRHREGQERDERDVPIEVARFDPYLSVIVRLEPRSDHVQLNIVKDHENEQLGELHLELDPSTLLLRWS